MKITIEKEDQKRLVDTVINELSEDTQDGYKKWKVSFQRNPIQEEFKNEMKIHLVDIMKELLDNDEFREKLRLIGKEYLKQFLDEKVDELVNKMME